MVPRTSKKRPIDAIAMEAHPPKNQWKSCQRCSIKKRRCAPPAGALPPFDYPCTFCKMENVPCIPPSSSAGPGTFSFAPGGCLNILGPLVGPDRPPHPVRATHTRTSAKWGESSICPTALNIVAVLRKAFEFGIEIPLFPTSDLFPDELPGVPTHGSALASVENLIAWNCELRNSWRDYASVHISHNALLAQVEVSKQGIANHDARRRLAWATWCYVTPLCLSLVHALLTCYLFHQITAYVYYWPAFLSYRTSFGLSRYLDT